MPLKSPLAVLVIILATITPGMALAEDGSSATVSVTGTGTVEAAPDMATLRIGVVREAPSARQALDENNAAMNKVLESLRAEGIAEKDLQTSGLEIQPRYVYPKARSDGTQEPPKIVGYTVSNNLDIRIREIDRTGGILDKVVTLGVNTGGSISFGNQKTASLFETARERAVADAISKATTLARAAGVGLGKLLSIREGRDEPRPIPLAQARTMAAAQASVVPVAAGASRYRVTVNMKWEIEQ